MRAELQQVQGITAAGLDAVCAALRARLLEVATREIADNDLRFEILRLLLRVAAVDVTMNSVGTNLLRQLTQSLGLNQGDYTYLQEQHREKLAVLAK